MGGGLMRILIAFEAAKLRASRLSWLALLGVATVSGLGSFLALATSKEPESVSSFLVAAGGLRWGGAFAGVVLLALGATMVASERRLGTWSTVLCHPVGRARWILAKAVVLGLGALALVAVVCLAAWIAGSPMGSGYGDVVDPDYTSIVHFSRAQLLKGSLLAAGLSLLGVWLAGLAGLFISSLFDGGGGAVGVALGGLLPLELLRQALGDHAAFVPTHLLFMPAARLSAFAQGFSDSQWELREILVSAASGLVVGGLALGLAVVRARRIDAS